MKGCVPWSPIYMKFEPDNTAEENSTSRAILARTQLQGFKPTDLSHQGSQSLNKTKQNI